MPTDPSRYLEPGRQSESEVEYRSQLEEYFPRSLGSFVERLECFPKYVPPQNLRKFLWKYEIFQKVLNLQGSIVECGVLFGGGLMSWATLSEIFEPFNTNRAVIGFDTFSGFQEISKQDWLNTHGADADPNRQSFDQYDEVAEKSYDDLLESIRIFDMSRVLSHIPKVTLVRGDVCETAPQYIKDNPHIIVSLLSLDVGLFEPTLAALRNFVPRMPKGGVIVFDELNHSLWPGETLAVLDEFGLNHLRIERLPFGPTMSFVVLD